MMTEKQIISLRDKSKKDLAEALKFQQSENTPASKAINKPIIDMSKAEIDILNKVLKG
jgi:hypothetical protein